MSAITAAELRAVRQVLAGKVSLVTVATDYTPREAILTAVAILWLAGWREPAFRQEFNTLLELLVREPGVPRDNFAGIDVENLPKWYTKKHPSLRRSERFYVSTRPTKTLTRGRS
jgi:hypothetical protein